MIPQPPGQPDVSDRAPCAELGQADPSHARTTAFPSDVLAWEARASLDVAASRVSSVHRCCIWRYRVRSVSFSSRSWAISSASLRRSSPSDSYARACELSHTNVRDRTPRLRCAAIRAADQAPGGGWLRRDGGHAGEVLDLLQQRCAHGSATQRHAASSKHAPESSILARSRSTGTEYASACSRTCSRELAATAPCRTPSSHLSEEKDVHIHRALQMTLNSGLWWAPGA